MGKVAGFMEYDRNVSSASKPLERIKNWNEFYTPLSESDRRCQGARCMDCGVPFCTSGIFLNGMATGCPLHNLIPEWNHFVYLGKWDKALERLLKTSNFPEFTSRVCPALCEHGCTLGLIDKSVTVRENEKYIIERAFSQGKIKPTPPLVRTGKKVCVVGSGPSGLAAADVLNKLGHTVTLYEREDKVGGLLRYGIPNMKLEKSIIDRRVNILEQEGINIKTCVDIGKDISVEKLKDEYDAIVMAIGACKPRNLNVKGRELNNIYFAVDFLKNNTKRITGSTFNREKDILAKNKNVVIIGGGDTGTDCVATSLRQGAKKITQLEIMNKPLEKRGENNPWPQYARILKTDYGQVEYIEKFGEDPRKYCTTVKEFIGDENNNIKQVLTVQVKWKKDLNGRMSPREVEGTEQYLDADLVLIAMGFVGIEDYVAKDLNVKLNARGNIDATYGEFKTTDSKVFAAGDARRGPSLVVWGINEGRNVAFQVDKYLMGEEL